jgi:hypothetical protein
MASDRKQPAAAGTAVPVTRTRLLGSLKEALAAASRDDRTISQVPTVTNLPAVVSAVDMSNETPSKEPEVNVQRGPSAAEAAREARGVYERPEDAHVELDAPPTRVVRGAGSAKASAGDDGGSRTQLVRGKAGAKQTEFNEDPVVGWLVVVGGLGLGSYRPIFEGNNTLGRAKSQRIPIDFGDDTISSEEQAYIRYDSVDRKFLLVPNLAKTNIVAVNDRKPTAAVELAAMDVLTIGRTQLAFVPFCGAEFDWSELTELKD